MNRLFITLATVFLCTMAGAQEKAEQSATDLAKQTQNPVLDLIRLPFQYNTYFETGPKGKTRNVLLIQPVIPYHINDD